MDNFKNFWLGKVVDYDRVYGYQCVDLIKQYLNQNFGLAPGAWGNAIDYWTNTNGSILTKFDKVAGSDARTGDIVVFKGLAGNPYGHIGIATQNADGTNVTVLEQNGSTGNGAGKGGDAIRTRAIARSRVAGLLRPKAPVALTTYVFLPGTPDNKAWRLYDVNVAPKAGNEKTFLNPFRYGGLEYKVVEFRDNGNTAVIDTSMYGRGKIWIASDTNAQIRKR